LHPRFYLLSEAGVSLVSPPNRRTMPVRLLKGNQRGIPPGFSVLRIAGSVVEQRLAYVS
jgi:hypothetical protein